MKRYDATDGIPTLHIALWEFMNVDDLKKLAALTKQPLPKGKAELVALIQRHLTGDRLRAAWESLDPLQQAAVAEVVHSYSNHFDAHRFQAKYGQQANWGTEGEHRYAHKPSALGFFFYGSNVMPDDLKSRLETFVPKPAPPTIQTLPELPPNIQQDDAKPVPLIVRESEQPAQRELLALLRLIDAGQVAVSNKTLRPSTATLTTITAVLEGGDYYPRLPVRDKWYDENAGPIRAFAWPLLLQAGGLARLAGSRLQLTKTGRQALVEPPAESIRSLWSKWLDSKLLDELARIDCVKGQTGKGKRGLTPTASRRTAIARTLANCPTGTWIAADEFLRFLRAAGHDFTVTNNPWHLYLAELQYGSFGYDNRADILDHRYLLAFLLEYAATLGLLDVALIPPAGARDDYGDLWGADDLVYFSRYDGLMYLRITPLGAYCLGSAPAYQPAPIEVRPVLRVLPSLEVTAIGDDLEPGDRLALDTYATRVADLVWRLDASKLLAAIEQGRPVEEIRQFLSARSGTAIPDSVSRLLDDLAERSTAIGDCGPARLLECADAALAARIATDTRTRKHCLPAGERHLVVPGSAEAAFKRALREIGFLVAAGATKVLKRNEPSAARAVPDVQSAD